MELRSGAILRVVGPAQLAAQLKAQDEARVAAEDSSMSQELSGLAAYVRHQYEVFRRHRNNTASGWSDRLLNAMRVFNGQYDAAKLSDIRRFGGSEIYARIIAMKCRGAFSLLRDVYLSPDRPWGRIPTIAAIDSD